MPRIRVVGISGALLCEADLNLGDRLCVLADRAAVALSAPSCKLVASGGSALTRSNTLRASGLRCDCSITAVAISLPKVFASPYGHAFAAVKGDGSVVTWGKADSGGDASLVKDQISCGVSHVVGTEGAFAALTLDGAVVTWGRKECGGHSEEVQKQLSTDVDLLSATSCEFVAIRRDGSLVTWGAAADTYNPIATGGIVEVVGNKRAFAAMKHDGGVITWGYAAYGGDSMTVGSLLEHDVKLIARTQSAFAALKTEGSVVTWGNSVTGGDSARVRGDIDSAVEHIVGNQGAFAALKHGGSVVVWGVATVGGDTSQAQTQLCNDVRSVSASGCAFAAIKRSGAVVTWGRAQSGGNCTSVEFQLASRVRSIAATKHAFAAIKEEGSLVTWGDADFGGHCPGLSSCLHQLQEFKPPANKFICNQCGLSSQPNSTFYACRDCNFDLCPKCYVKRVDGAVAHVVGNQCAFAAVRNDGTVFAWGAPQSGGDLSRELFVDGLDHPASHRKRRRWD